MTTYDHPRTLCAIVSKHASNAGVRIDSSHRNPQAFIRWCVRYAQQHKLDVALSDDWKEKMGNNMDDFVNQFFKSYKNKSPFYTHYVPRD